MITEAFILLAIIYVALMLFFNKVHRKVISKGPPLICGYIPFVGIAVEYGMDPRAKIAQLSKKYGDIFTIYVMGQFITVVTNPVDVAKIYSSPKTFNFFEVGIEFGNRAFTLPRMDDQTNNTLIHDIHHGLQSQELPVLTERANTFIQRDFKNFRSKDWKKVNLVEWVGDIISSVTLRAVYGENCNFKEMAKTFFPFDDKFAIIASNIPFAVKKKTGLFDIRDSFATNFVPRPEDDACLFLHKRYDAFKGIKDLSSIQLGNAMSIIGWAALTNTITTTVWTIYHLLKQPQSVRDEVLDEIRDVLGERSDGGALEIPYEQLSNLKKVDAIVSESLRLHFGVLSSRMCMKKHNFESSSGRSYELPARGLMLLASSHHDPHFFKDPETFIWDRFLHMPSSVIAKNGKSIPLSSVYLPFGGGANLCPGRFFAKNEIKIMVCLLLTSFDMKVETEEEPETDKMKWTLQVGPFKEGNIEIRYKNKE
ncbi:25/26-hydroxycholesterol 7alpha-hydroxylase [Acrasis kona]|uniref:25/26-hydroxycholesterol 7alpha-hydroxylase n=1 Tax=Acrasis kona TaxID=1008807 RepID=A0AAW2ZHP6_9EUKA